MPTLIFGLLALARWYRGFRDGQPFNAWGLAGTRAQIPPMQVAPAYGSVQLPPGGSPRMTEPTVPRWLHVVPHVRLVALAAIVRGMSYRPCRPSRWLARLDEWTNRQRSFN